MGESTIIVQRDPNQIFMEKWRNVTRGKIVIKRLGDFGKPSSDIVHPGMAFQISKAERKYNQNAVAKPKMDIFTNGRLQPIELDPEDPETEGLIGNPNHVAEDDIGRIFKLRGERLKDRLSHIDSTATLRRLLELAELESTQALWVQHKAIEARLWEVDKDIQHIHPKIQEAIERGEDPNIENDGIRAVPLGR